MKRRSFLFTLPLITASVSLDARTLIPPPKPVFLNASTIFNTTTVLIDGEVTPYKYLDEPQETKIEIKYDDESIRVFKCNKPIWSYEIITNSDCHTDYIDYTEIENKIILRARTNPNLITKCVFMEVKEISLEEYNK